MKAYIKRQFKSVVLFITSFFNFLNCSTPIGPSLFVLIVSIYIKQQCASQFNVPTISKTGFQNYSRIILRYWKRLHDQFYFLVFSFVGLKGSPLHSFTILSLIPLAVINNSVSSIVGCCDTINRIYSILGCIGYVEFSGYDVWHNIYID